MAFRIIDRPEFIVDVSVTMPDGETQTLTTSYHGLPEEELGDLDWTPGEPFRASLRTIVKGFTNVEGPDGKVVSTVTQDHPLFEAVIAQGFTRVALMRSYHNAMSGLAGVRRGN